MSTTLYWMLVTGLGYNYVIFAITFLIQLRSWFSYPLIRNGLYVESVEICIALQPHPT